MCGIIAILSTINRYNYIIQGLRHLQNRGYDSAGIAYMLNNMIHINKYASNKDTLALDMLQTHTPHIQENKDITTLMAHTRWATHGKKNAVNAHPHISFDKKISIIHNGIIENYVDIQTFLATKDIYPISTTDSELIAHLIAYYYSVTKHIKQAIRKCNQYLKGSWSIVIMCVDTPDTLYGIKQHTPLLLGLNTNNSMCMFVSELSAFNKNITNYIIPNDNEIITIYKEKQTIHYNCCNTSIYYYDNPNQTDITPHPYTYWLEKEINEQYDCIKKIIDNISNKYCQILDINTRKYQLLYIDNIILLGCGTSYYACMLGELYLKQIKYFSSVRAYDASNFTKSDIPTKGRTCVILLSQSGETKDLIRCLDYITRPNIVTISILNVLESYISRHTDIKLYINAGREISVPSTKSFTGQLFILRLLADWFVNNSIQDNDCIYLYDHIQKTLQLCQEQIAQYIPALVKPSMFILGKGKFFPLAKEAALKIKEISYIHAEGYAASALKHGPYALLEPEFPVILFIMNDIYKDLMMNCYSQILAREGFILVITDIPDLDVVHKLIIPKTKYNEILAIIVIQYISFYLGKHLGLPIDTPRNLAQCVTTD